MGNYRWCPYCGQNENEPDHGEWCSGQWGERPSKTVCAECGLLVAPRESLRHADWHAEIERRITALENP
jgi:hypothetical protein